MIANYLKQGLCPLPSKAQELVHNKHFASFKMF